MEEKLWQQLRDEANAVKDCFTTFSFQAVAFSAIVLSAVASYQPTQPLVGLAGVLVVAVLLTVSRIGGYKYSTANRHFAFQLYHETFGRDSEIGWEEALQAWRVVAAAIFDSLYITPSDRKRSVLLNVLIWTGWSREQLEPKVQKALEDRSLSRDERAKRFWFDAAAQVEPQVWHPGRYLQQMQAVLHFISWLAVLPLVLMTLQLAAPLDRSMRVIVRDPAVLAALFSVVATAGFVVVRTRQLRARRRILEGGMLSIPASAVVWHAAVTAHGRARAMSKSNPALYLRHLADLAKKASAEPQNIWQWLHHAEAEGAVTASQGAT